MRVAPSPRPWAALALLLLGVATCEEPAPSARVSRAPVRGGADDTPFPGACGLTALRVGLIPYASHPMHAALAPLEDFLARHLDLPVDVRAFERYADVTDEIVKGSLDIAILPPLAWLLAHEQEPDLHLLATKISGGAVDYPGYLVGRRTGPTRTLQDAGGLRVAFASYDSASGFLVPLARLADEGLEPRQILSRHVLAGSHVEAVRALLEGRADLAATFRGGIEAARSAGIDTGALRVIGITAPIPQDALVARADLAPEAQACARHAFLALSNATPAGRQALARVAWIEGWTPTDASFYEPLAAVLARVRALAPEVAP